MAENVIPADLLALLRQVDTPTVCNAIEVAQGKRGFNRFTRGTMQHSKPGDPAMVGFARTAKISGLLPAREPADVIRARRMDYFKSMAAGQGPRLAVIEDIDFPNCIAGWWGEIHVAVHKGLGQVGAITNGVMCDLDVMDAGFPVLAGSIGPSHGFFHVVEIGGACRPHGNAYITRRVDACGQARGDSYPKRNHCGSQTSHRNSHRKRSDSSRSCARTWL